jgi:hypothetical protein
MTLGIRESLITYIGLKRKSGGSRGVVTDAREVGHGVPPPGVVPIRESVEPPREWAGESRRRGRGHDTEGEGHRVGAVLERRLPR